MIQPKEKQALQKTCVILRKMDDSSEKTWSSDGRVDGGPSYKSHRPKRYKESVAECESAERLLSLTVPAWLKQTDNFYFNIYFHVGEFSLKLCIHSCGVSMALCIHARPWA